MDDDDDIPTETSSLLNNERNNADRMERGNIPKAEPEQPSNPVVIEDDEDVDEVGTEDAEAPEIGVEEAEEEQKPAEGEDSLRTAESSEGSTSASGSQGDVIAAEAEPVPQIAAEGEEATAGGNTAFTATAFLDWTWDKRRHFLAATLFISLCLNDQQEIKTLISENRGVLDLILDGTSGGFAEVNTNIQCVQDDTQYLIGLAEKNAKDVQSLKEDVQSVKEDVQSVKEDVQSLKEMQEKERQLSKDRYAYMMQQLGVTVPRELLE